MKLVQGCVRRGEILYGCMLGQFNRQVVVRNTVLPEQGAQQVDEGGVGKLLGTQVDG